MTDQFLRNGSGRPDHHGPAHPHDHPVALLLPQVRGDVPLDPWARRSFRILAILAGVLALLQVAGGLLLTWLQESRVERVKQHDGRLLVRVPWVDPAGPDLANGRP